MNVLISIARVAVIALVVLIIGGCDCMVSMRDSLNTSFGPGQAPSTYRVGGERIEGATDARVRVIREAEVDSGWTTGTGAGAAPAVTIPPPATQPTGG